MKSLEDTSMIRSKPYLSAEIMVFLKQKLDYGLQFFNAELLVLIRRVGRAI